MTMQEIMNAHEGHTEKDLNKWRRTRWLGYVMAKGNGSKINSPSDLMELPGDDQNDSIEEGIKRIKEIRDGRS